MVKPQFDLRAIPVWGRFFAVGGGCVAGGLVLSLLLTLLPVPRSSPAIGFTIAGAGIICLAIGLIAYFVHRNSTRS